MIVPLIARNTLNISQTYPSPLADGGSVSWSQSTRPSTPGVYEVSYPDIRWKELRGVFGWASLQHHSVLHTTLTITHSAEHGGLQHISSIPVLSITLQQASYITLVPRISQLESQDIHGQAETLGLRWHEGDIYAQSPSQPILLPLCHDLLRKPRILTYDVYLSVDYEIRLFGDPLVRHDSDVPISWVIFKPELKWLDDVASVEISMMPDFMEGWALGDVIGVSVKNGGLWAEIESVDYDHNLVSTMNFTIMLTR